MYMNEDDSSLVHGDVLIFDWRVVAVGRVGCG